MKKTLLIVLLLPYYPRLHPAIHYKANLKCKISDTGHPPTINNYSLVNYQLSNNQNPVLIMNIHKVIILPVIGRKGKTETIHCHYFKIRHLTANVMY